MLILICGPSKILIIETPAGEQIEFIVLNVKGNQVRTCTVVPDKI